MMNKSLNGPLVTNHSLNPLHLTSTDTDFWAFLRNISNSLKMVNNDGKARYIYVEDFSIVFKTKTSCIRLSNCNYTFRYKRGVKTLQTAIHQALQLLAEFGKQATIHIQYQTIC